jgi:hypothetical protein
MILAVPQMFVFGEIQEPLTETVNLVENIIRSQLVELVRPPYVSLSLAADLCTLDRTGAGTGK